MAVILCELHAPVSSEELQLLKLSGTEKIDEMLSPNLHGTADIDPKTIAVLTELDTKESFRSSVFPLATEMKNALESGSDITVTICVSLPFEDPVDSGKHCARCAELMRHKLLYSENQILFCGDNLRQNCGKTSRVDVSARLEPLMASLEKGDFELSRTLLYTLFDELRSGEQDAYNWLRQFLICFQGALLQRIEVLGFSVKSGDFDTLAPLEYTSSIDDIRAETLRIAEKFILLLNTERHENENSYVKYALSYIDENYRSDISLSDVCGSVSVTPQYVSRLIREATGQAFPEYINSLRIAAARDMLRSDRSVRIRDVAQSVGFNNVNYFNKVFKRVTGVTPSEFQDLSD